MLLKRIGIADEILLPRAEISLSCPGEAVSIESNYHTPPRHLEFLISLMKIYN